MPRRITALQTFQRKLRDEPPYGIYKHRVYPEQDKVTVDQVKGWLMERYTRRRGLWQIIPYRHVDGNEYVHYFEMQTVTDNELFEIKMRWGMSQKPLKRDGRLKNKRLTKEQRKAFNAHMIAARNAFYDSLQTA